MASYRLLRLEDVLFIEAVEPLRSGRVRIRLPRSFEVADREFGKENVREAMLLIVETLHSFVTVRELLESAAAGGANDGVKRLLQALLLPVQTKRKRRPPQWTVQHDEGATDAAWETYNAFVGLGNMAVPTSAVDVICHPTLSLQPDLEWGWMLRRWEGHCASLVSANAMLNTLGGGYFLCRQADSAIRMARAQQVLAARADDRTLLGRCRINEAYSLIWLGNYGRARHIIAAELAAARQAGNTELEGHADVALLFLRRARAATRRLGLKPAVPLLPAGAGDGSGGGGDGGDGDRGGGSSIGGGENGGGSEGGAAPSGAVSATRDDFFRVRPIHLPQ
ncbi:unnamed protein product [Phaeothamnion confervicola]